MLLRVIAALVACVCMSTASNAQRVPPVEAFSRHPQVAAPVISPNGRRIAMLSQSDGQQIVFVLSRDGEAPTGANVERVRVERLFWASDDVLIIAASIPQQNSGWGVLDHRTMFALDLNDPGRLHELLAGGNAPQHLFPQALFFHPLNEVFGDLVVDVGLQESHPNFAQRILDVVIG